MIEYSKNKLLEPKQLLIVPWVHLLSDTWIKGTSVFLLFLIELIMESMWSAAECSVRVYVIRILAVYFKYSEGIQNYD